MPMTSVLRVRMHGSMQPETLLRMRELLQLKRLGRLTDAEDVDFGYRYLQHDDHNWIFLDLLREDDMMWSFDLTCLKEPPSHDVIDQTLTAIRAVAGELGFTIGEVFRR